MRYRDVMEGSEGWIGDWQWRRGCGMQVDDEENGTSRKRGRVPKSI